MGSWVLMRLWGGVSLKLAMASWRQMSLLLLSLGDSEAGRKSGLMAPGGEVSVLGLFLSFFREGGSALCLSLLLLLRVGGKAVWDLAALFKGLWCGERVSAFG